MKMYANNNYIIRAVARNFVRVVLNFNAIIFLVLFVFHSVQFCQVCTVQCTLVHRKPELPAAETTRTSPIVKI